MEYMSWSNPVQVLVHWQSDTRRPEEAAVFMILSQSSHQADSQHPNLAVWPWPQHSPHHSGDCLCLCLCLQLLTGKKYCQSLSRSETVIQNMTIVYSYRILKLYKSVKMIYLGNDNWRLIINIIKTLSYKKVI